jgi:hypothetical protein
MCDSGDGPERNRGSEDDKLERASKETAAPKRDAPTGRANAK